MDNPSMNKLIVGTHMLFYPFLAPSHKTCFVLSDTAYYVNIDFGLVVPNRSPVRDGNRLPFLIPDS